MLVANSYKNQSKVSTQTRHQYLDYLIDSSFQEVNMLFYQLIILFNNNGGDDGIGNTSKSTTGKNFLRTYASAYESIKKNTSGQRNHYTTGCVLGYIYFKENCKLTAIDLSKQQEPKSNFK